MMHSESVTDFLADAYDSDRLQVALLGLGYRCVNRGEDAANYLRGDEGLDFLHAHREISRRLLATAVPGETTLAECVTSAQKG